MGKKGKTGKSRRDKFYHLAKETGYRARSAFKLIQLNRKFEFLQKSRVVIDLCAAPGGWLQVVAENTPVSSLIIGVDLVPIKPIPKVSTFQEDITTEKCRQTLKKELQTWKADAVINDGAPNIGKNWIHDAFQQAELTLQALKLATEFLRKGGWFVTKVFRSKDYNSLMWIFQQLFKKVHATKPQASRNESAEIFVVCEKFLAPDRIDPRFLDPKFVFKEIEAEPKQTINLIHPDKKKRQREGYAEGDYTLFHTLKASKFIQSENHLDLLAEASEIVIDDDVVATHPATTTEIKACLTDIKVLGKKDIRNLLNWRKKIKKETTSETKKEKPSVPSQPDGEQESEDDEEALVEEKLAEMEEEERKALKRKLKKVRKEKTKLQHKMDMKMVIPGDKHDFSDDVGLFNIKKIKSKAQLEDIEAGDSYQADALAMDNEAEDSEDDVPLKNQKKTVKYYRDSKDHLDMDDSPSDSGEEEPEFLYDSADDDLEFQEDEDDEEDNPLVISLESKPNKAHRKSVSWFSKDSFAGLEEEEDEDLELEKMAEDYKQRGGQVIEQEKDSGMSDGTDSDDDDDSTDEEDTSDSESDYDTAELHKQMSSKPQKQQKGKQDSKSGFEIVPAGQNLPRLDPVGLAIGSQMVQSRKRRRELVEGSYHRYMFDDENLPDWFVKDERKHFKHQLPVSKGDIEEFKMKMKAIDARPIKKIAEAKARKKKKELRRHERARKKAEAISDTADISDRDKWQQIKQVYKKAGLLSQKKKEITYVVAKKGVGRRVRRPAGVQGPFRVVDPRMKKDRRSMNKQTKGKGQKVKNKSSQSNRGKKRK